MRCKRQVWGTVITLVLGILATSACASPVLSDGEGTAEDIPEFTGPYAQMLTDVYRKSSDAWVRSALRDGEVTDAERAESVQRFSGCMESNGYSLERFDYDTGSYEIGILATNPDPHAEDASGGFVHDCNLSSGMGFLDMMYQEMKLNPMNRDHSEIMVECLHALEAVAPGYSVTDFDREYPEHQVTLTRPELTQTPQDPVRMCEADPIGVSERAQHP